MQSVARLGALVSASAMTVLLAACSSTTGDEATGAASSNEANALWSMLRVEADYDVINDVDKLVAATGTEHTIRGRVVSAAPGLWYEFEPGDVFESAYLTIDVSDSDIPGLETATVEIVKPPTVSGEDLGSAAVGDEEVVFLLRTGRLFEDVPTKDLDDKPDPKNLYTLSSQIMGALGKEGNSIVSLTLDEEILADSDSSSAGELMDEVATSLP